MLLKNLVRECSALEELDLVAIGLTEFDAQTLADALLGSPMIADGTVLRSTVAIATDGVRDRGELHAPLGDSDDRTLDKADSELDVLGGLAPLLADSYANLGWKSCDRRREEETKSRRKAPVRLAPPRNPNTPQLSSTLNPQPSTPNPQPSTLNPQPSTLNPQSSYLVVDSATDSHLPHRRVCALSALSCAQSATSHRLSHARAPPLAAFDVRALALTLADSPHRLAAGEERDGPFRHETAGSAHRAVPQSHSPQPQRKPHRSRWRSGACEGHHTGAFSRMPIPKRRP